MKLVSIIVPVYNAEKYIKNCVLSILNQDYKNIELILVNDGSKDNSYNICKQLAEKDNRIRLFNKENGGTSSARNYGLDNAKGEYVCFIDSDDFACPNYVTTLLAATQNADMGIGGFKEVKEKKLAKACRVEYEKKIENVKLEKNEFFKLMFSYPNIGGGSLANKMFKKSILENMRFNTTYTYYEDIVFLFKYAVKCQTFCYNPSTIFLYNLNLASQTHSKKLNRKRLSCLDVMDEIVSIAETINQDVVSYAKAWQFLVNIEMRWLIHLNKFKDEKIQNKINATLKETYKDFKKNKKNFHSFRKFGGLAYKLMQVFNY